MSNLLGVGFGVATGNSLTGVAIGETLGVGVGMGLGVGRGAGLNKPKNPPLPKNPNWAAAMWLPNTAMSTTPRSST